jgi:hypothetical protein
MNRTSIDWADKTWNAVPGYEGYYASRDGQIVSLRRRNRHIMKPIVGQDGHLYVFMSVDREEHKMYVHRAVLSAWKGLPTNGQEARHLNDNPKDNDIRNLEWGTRLENMNDKRINGGMSDGEKSGTHKLTREDVLAIRQLHGTKTLRALGQQFGVSHTAIRRAALGIKWGCVKEGLR